MPSASRKYKTAIYEQLARVGKSLASGTRLELLDLLCQGPRTVDVLARQAGQTIANTSHHLKVLREARLIDAEKVGVYVTYRLADERVCELFLSLRVLAESRLFEIEQVTREYLEDRGAMEPVNREVLASRVVSGEVTVLDVRPREEYEAGHISGALSVPLEELAELLEGIDVEQQVVAYCRGPYCVLSVEAVQVLRDHGFDAHRLADGVHDWKARGFEIVGGTQPK